MRIHPLLPCVSLLLAAAGARAGELTPVLLAIALAATSIGCDVSPKGPTTTPPAKQANDPAGVVGVPFALLKKPSISKTHGHAHLPILGGMGKNEYLYDGALEFDGKQAHLTSSFHPIALYQFDGGHFLLGQSWFNQARFQWYAYALKSNSFEKVEIGDVSRPVFAVHPVDHRVSSFFRLWMVSELLATADAEAAAKLFSEYVDENPRFPYEHNLGQKFGMYTTLPDLLRKVWEKKADGFYGPLLLVLDHSEPTDNSQDVGFVAYAVKELRAEGDIAVQDFIRKVEAEGSPNDPRLLRLKN